MIAPSDCIVEPIPSVELRTVYDLALVTVLDVVDLAELVDRLARPRRVWIMIPAALVDGVIDQLAPLLDPGDVVIDGGNTFHRLDIARPRVQQFTMGMGSHICLGASLARAELQTMIGALVARFPSMRLLEEEPQYRDSLVLRGLKHLRVQL